MVIFHSFLLVYPEGKSPWKSRGNIAPQKSPQRWAAGSAAARGDGPATAGRGWWPVLAPGPERDWRWGPHGWKIMGKHGQTQCVKENRGKYRGVFGSNPVFLEGNMVSNTMSNGKIWIETHWLIGIVWVKPPFAWRNHGNHHSYTICIQMGGNPCFYIGPSPFLQERVTKPTKSDVWCPKQSDARNNQVPSLRMFQTTCTRSQSLIIFSWAWYYSKPSDLHQSDRQASGSTEVQEKVPNFLGETFWLTLPMATHPWPAFLDCRRWRIAWARPNRADPGRNRQLTGGSKNSWV